MEGKALTYYLIFLTEETLFAYGDCYEFFRFYDKKNKQWTISKISFSQMLHDFWYKKISEAEAKKLTDNNLPTKDYQKYCDRLTKK